MEKPATGSIGLLLKQVLLCRLIITTQARSGANNSPRPDSRHKRMERPDGFFYEPIYRLAFMRHNNAVSATRTGSPALHLVRHRELGTWNL